LLLLHHSLTNKYQIETWSVLSFSTTSFDFTGWSQERILKCDLLELKCLFHNRNC